MPHRHRMPSRLLHGFTTYAVEVEDGMHIHYTQFGDQTMPAKDEDGHIHFLGSNPMSPESFTGDAFEDANEVGES